MADAPKEKTVEQLKEAVSRMPAKSSMIVTSSSPGPRLKEAKRLLERARS